MLGLRWRALPHNLIVHFSRGMAPNRFLGRGGFALASVLLVCALIALGSWLAPRAGASGRGAATLVMGWIYGLTGFAAGVFWSLVRVNIGVGSAVRPAVALGLGCAALGLVLGVSQRARLPALASPAEASLE